MGNILYGEILDERLDNSYSAYYCTFGSNWEECLCNTSITRLDISSKPIARFYDGIYDNLFDDKDWNNEIEYSKLQVRRNCKK